MVCFKNVFKLTLKQDLQNTGHKNTKLEQSILERQRIRLEQNENLREENFKDSTMRDIIKFDNEFRALSNKIS